MEKRIRGKGDGGGRDDDGDDGKRSGKDAKVKAKEGDKAKDSEEKAAEREAAKAKAREKFADQMLEIDGEVGPRSIHLGRGCDPPPFIHTQSCDAVHLMSPKCSFSLHI